MTGAKRIWAGRVISALPVLMLLFSGGIKLINTAPEVAESMTKLGYPLGLTRPIGLLELACVVVYAIPRTSALGAILMTGHLGGAVASHVRVGDPMFSHVLFPVYIGVLAWAGLYLRDDRLRALLSKEKRP
jgi:hypothetical protein